MEKTDQDKRGPSGVFERLNKRLLVCQRRLADYLNCCCLRVSGTGLRLALLLFCLIAGSYFLLLILNAFN